MERRHPAHEFCRGRFGPDCEPVTRPHDPEEYHRMRDTVRRLLAVAAVAAAPAAAAAQPQVYCPPGVFAG